MEMDGMTRYRVRTALISARYEHQVCTTTDKKIVNYLRDEGLIDDPLPTMQYNPATKTAERCRITDKGKQVLYKLRVQGGQYRNNPLVNPPETSESIYQKPLWNDPHG